MAQALAFTHTRLAPLTGESLRAVIVSGCALALICAKAALPF
jgi:hypothetical protein